MHNQTVNWRKSTLKKIEGFKFHGVRELVLLTENERKFSVYTDIIPLNMRDVALSKKYSPCTSREGRHADIEAVARSLGYSHTAFPIHVKSESGLVLLLNWFRYA